ncbi:MAG: hypothetical protein PF486_01220 [Prolixibacteraceae bacterium]|jgi:hypothetical protein|nr:hypothetical protein [Prolixibacteraceae bacterium]
MEKPKVFCEVEFLNKYSKARPIANFENSSKDDTWKSYWNFISASAIQLNISIEEFKNLADKEEIYKHIWKSVARGRSEISFTTSETEKNQTLENHIVNNKSSCGTMYLVDKKCDTCNKISEDYGVWIINSEQLYLDQNQNMFKMVTEPIKKSDRTLSPWNFMKPLKHPCNSLAILDNYLMKSNQSINDSLIPLLNYLLPSRLRIPFHLSIFTLKEFREIGTGHKRVDFNNRITKLKNELEKIRPNLNFKISFFEIKPGKEHDRSLITNYLLVESGSGFDLYKNQKTTHKTSVKSYFPATANFIANNRMKDFVNVKESLKKTFKQAVSNEYMKNYWGVKDNRLLE